MTVRPKTVEELIARETWRVIDIHRYLVASLAAIAAADIAVGMSSPHTAHLLAVIGLTLLIPHVDIRLRDINGGASK